MTGTCLPANVVMYRLSLSSYYWVLQLSRSILADKQILCDKAAKIRNMVKVKVKFSLEQAMKTQRGVVIQLYSFFNFGARWGQVVNTTPWPLYPRERDPVPIVQEDGWAPGPVWMGVENLVLTGIRCLDRPAHSKLLYLLRYPSL